MRCLSLTRTAMETHFKVACVQEQALYFIGNLAHDTENKAQLMDLLPLVRYCVCVSLHVRCCVTQ